MTSGDISAEISCITSLLGQVRAQLGTDKSDLEDLRALLSRVKKAREDFEDQNDDRIRHLYAARDIENVRTAAVYYHGMHAFLKGSGFKGVDKSLTQDIRDVRAAISRLERQVGEEESLAGTYQISLSGLRSKYKAAVQKENG